MGLGDTRRSIVRSGNFATLLNFNGKMSLYLAIFYENIFTKRPFPALLHT